MIAQKHGRIVSICSYAVCDAVPLGVVYTASKHGLHGFMTALGDELKLLNIDCIKLTAIYPTFISTRSELTEVVNSSILFECPMLTPEEAAAGTVEAILSYKKEKVLCNWMFKVYR